MKIPGGLLKRKGSGNGWEAIRYELLRDNDELGLVTDYWTEGN